MPVEWGELEKSQEVSAFFKILNHFEITIRLDELPSGRADGGKKKKGEDGEEEVWQIQ